MIGQLKLAGDRLRESWDDYCEVYSTLQSNEASRSGPNAHGLPLELTRQLDAELALLSSYELKIREIKVTIGRARNYSSGIAAVNTLPTEILRRIFHFVVALPCNPHLSPTSTRHCPRYADCLAHVCSLWRRIAISSRELWCRIDLSPFCWPDKLVNRVQSYVARAGELPLELHIATNSSTRWIPEHSELSRLLPRIATRIETLELLIAGPCSYFHRNVLGLLALHHAVLNKFDIRTYGCDTTNIFCFDPRYPQGAMSLSQGWNSWSQGSHPGNDVIENSLAALTVLHLRDTFPLWSSKAYHGIVDLRLLSTSDWVVIREADLIGILNSSPGLRILHFGLEICESMPFSEDVAPVYLQDLQVVKTFIHHAEETEFPPNGILRLLAPGTKPIRLSIEGHYMQGSLSIPDAESFFERSRVAMFHTRTIFPPMSLLLRHAAHLESVVLQDFGTSSVDELPPLWLQGELASLPPLKSLHITGSRLSVRELSFLLDCCPSGTVLHDCKVEYGDDGVESELARFEAEELLNNFPDVRITDSAWKAPTADWDILD